MEIGLFQVPFHPDNPYLFFPFWGCFLLAIGIQALLLKKYKTGIRWSFLIFSLIGFFCCEIACQIIIGWDLILWLVLWFLFLTFLFGSVVCILVYNAKKRSKP